MTVPFLLNGKKIWEDETENIDCIVVPMKKRIDYELELRSAKKANVSCLCRKRPSSSEIGANSF